MVPMATRPGAPVPAPPTGATASGSRPLRSLETALTETLDLLRGLHLRLTLCAVETTRPMPAELQSALVEALGRSGTVGRLPDGRLGLIHLAVAGVDRAAAAALHDDLWRRLKHRLAVRGWGGFLRSISLATTDGWTDRIASADQLIATLPPCFEPAAT